MKMKFICILINLILVLTFISGFAYAIDDNRIEMLENNDNILLKIIEDTKDKNLICNKIIGNHYVKYWMHVKHGVEIKGDYILLHKNINNEIEKYLKIWIDVNFDIPNYDDNKINNDDILWKKIVYFPDEEDCLRFYNFKNDIEYPILCWEVRHLDGDTILYDFDWSIIGYGTPAPSTGYSLSGYNDVNIPDAWIEFRQSADNWFKKWCEDTISVSFPEPSEISSIIQDDNVDYFYELAHGDEYYFQ